MTRPLALALGALLLGLGAGAGYWYATYRMQGMNAQDGSGTPAVAAAAKATPGASGDKIDPKTGRPVLYWHDPMVPGHRFDKPGKSPFMDMQLVPVYADEANDAGGVTINARLQQNLGVRIAEATMGAMAPKVEAVGSVAFNERAVAEVTARATGFIEKLYVRAPLDPVRAGQPLVEILAPDWVAAQEEYLALAGSDAPGADALRQAARQRLQVLGMPEAVIRAVERDGRAHPRVVLTAPINGVIGELSVREGMTAMMGAPLFRINGIATVWVNAEVPEMQARWVKPDNPVEARVPAYPGQVFKGRVSALLPEVNLATRTLKARIELNNPGGLLKPGMFATIDFAAAAKNEALQVPSEAVIRTGKRDIVILAAGEGKFRPVDVEVGTEADGKTEIRKGLEAGQKVVVSGQFLIDSEASLKATVSRLEEVPPPASGAAKADRHHGEGVVEAVAKDAVTLSHDPIPSLNWGAMTMSFKAPAGGLPAGIKVGDRVSFEFSDTPKGEFEILAIKALAPAVPQAQGQGDRP